MKDKKISKLREKITQIDAWDAFGWKQMKNHDFNVIILFSEKI